MIPSLEPTLAFPSMAELTREPASRVALKCGTVDLWSASLEGSAALLARCHGWLSEDERARAARFIRPEDQMRFTFAHGGLRVVLARYVGVDPASLKFRHSSTGKPALLDLQDDLQSLRFNLSHSHGRMLIAVTNNHDVGTDLEQVRNNLDSLKLAERFYTTTEYEWIKSRPASDHAVEFYRLWVAKEALLKAQGTGIPSLQQCEILATPASPRANVRLTPDSAMQQGWTIRWLSCGPGWEGAVSAYGNDWSVRVPDTGGI